MRIRACILYTIQRLPDWVINQYCFSVALSNILSSFYFHCKEITSLYFWWYCVFSWWGLSYNFMNQSDKTWLYLYIHYVHLSAVLSSQMTDRLVLFLCNTIYLTKCRTSSAYKKKLLKTNRWNPVHFYHLRK